MTLDLNAMALFVHVVQNKSFSETAKRTGTPISTISRKVSELEKSLNIRLLERSTRSLRLTEIGQQYYEYCRRGLEEFESGTLMINDKQTELSGTLRFSAPPNLANVLIAPMVCAFQNEYPKVKIKILISESNLIAHEIIQYRHLLVASKEYLKDTVNLKQPKDLNNHRIITFGGWHSDAIWKLKNKDKTEKFKANGVLSINDYAGIIYATEHSQGIAEIPAIICQDLIQSGRLVEVLPKWNLPNTKLSIVYPSNRNISRMVRLFIDFCIQYVTEWETT